MAESVPKQIISFRQLAFECNSIAQLCQLIGLPNATTAMTATYMDGTVVACGGQTDWDPESKQCIRFIQENSTWFHVSLTFYRIADNCNQARA